MVSNDIKRTNVPDIRVGYRYDTLCEELRGLIPQPSPAHQASVASNMSLGSSPPKEEMQKLNLDSTTEDNYDQSEAANDDDSSELC